MAMSKRSERGVGASVDRPKVAQSSRRSSSIMNRYDVTQGVNADGGRMRRPAHIETTGEEGVLHPYDRLKALSLTRDLVRNSGMTRGLNKVLRVNVVGAEGKLKFRRTGDWYDTAAHWFNSVWSKSADFVDGTTWRECLQLAVYALSFEGEFVVVYDDGLLSPNGGTGKLCFFESDRIAAMSESRFSEYAKKGYRQDNGIIFDALGRKCGVIISSKPGSVVADDDKCLVLMRNPDDDPLSWSWRHVMRKFRLRQGRGIADAVTAAPTAVDAMEILGLEMQSAKAGAAHYATVYQADDPVDAITGLGYVDEDGDNCASNDEESDVEPDNENTPPFVSTALERLTGGNVDYLRKDDKVEVAPTSRPNPNLAPFLDYAGDVSGAAFGLSHSYARLKADTSYTSYRGDMTMTWRTLSDFQQFIEDAFSDWVAVRVIRRAIDMGILTEAPADWENAVAWQYPDMPAVDEQKEQAALAQKLKNGATTYRDILGPDWRKRMDDLAEEVDYARKKGIPLSLLETASGNVAPTADSKSATEE